ncbi:MAG: stress response translation initiation inhibitor YciH [Candidatus Omnitrophica bacterium]|nr:stress response translation initiation inhibitor YciH [Candidatus Omnitrophota bacterium]
MKTGDSRLVYSTQVGAVCPDCGKPKNSCICRQLKRKAVPQASGNVRIRYETAGRKGKGMTLITGLPLSQEALLDLAKKLKQQLGTGGAVKDYVIELQGDHCKKVSLSLRKLGYSI